MRPVTKLQELIARIDAFFARHHAALAQQGTVRSSARERSGRMGGCYFRLEVRRADGRRESVYLGTDSPLVESVRHRLEELRRPLRQRRNKAAAERLVRRGGRAARAAMAQVLAPLGLHFRGTEVRGLAAFKRAQRLTATAPEIEATLPKNPEI